MNREEKVRILKRKKFMGDVIYPMMASFAFFIIIFFSIGAIVKAQDLTSDDGLAAYVKYQVYEPRFMDYGKTDIVYSWKSLTFQLYHDNHVIQKVIFYNKTISDDLNWTFSICNEPEKSISIGILGTI